MDPGPNSTHPSTHLHVLIHVSIHVSFHVFIHVPFHVFLHAVVHVSHHRKPENRSCAGNDVTPASALQSAVSSSLTREFGAAVLNSATHEVLLKYERTSSAFAPGLSPPCHQVAPLWTGRTNQPPE